MSDDLRDRARQRPRRATTTSDVSRVRILGLVAAGAALGTCAVVAFAGSPLGASRPLARPHEKAKIACEKCHSRSTDAPASFAASTACVACHASAEHVSTRAAHRALTTRGELTCATCHPAHAGAQGVTFEKDGAVVRWGAGAQDNLPSRAAGAPGEATVPFVALATCGKCHDSTRASDPIAACVPSSVRSGARTEKMPSLCFDEHRTLKTAKARFVAWEAAREVSLSTPWIDAPGPTSVPWAPAAGAAAFGLAFGASAAVVARRRREAPKTAAAPTVAATRKKLPVIDTSTCLGCYACVDACPFDVLTVERYVAVVARPEECCGVVLCEQVCPNGSLKVAEGDVVPDQPRVDEHLESANVPGLYLAGDLTGLPLIKNAILQGARAVQRIATTLPRRQDRAGVDVLVVGAGPAGLSAALAAKERGLSCVVLEQATVAASIKSFPREKIVYDPPLDLPVEGELWLRQATKEELLLQWARIVRSRALDIREGRRVTDIHRERDDFVVRAAGSNGDEVFRAARVVLAIGRRGTPRALDLEVDENALDRVHYSLVDARSFADKRVVVVGLGDTAMEAAIALSRQPGTNVTVSYRGASFQRGKARNIAEMKQLVDKGRIRVLFDTVPLRMTQSGVTLGRTVDGHRQTVGADALFVLIGGLPAWDFLARVGVTRRKP